MKLKHYLVYLITNTINGKIYVGQHQTYDVDDGYMGSGYALNAAYEKYGMDKFVKTILADFDDFDCMNNMEAVIVDKEFVERKDTYNESVGGTKGWQAINELRKATPELEPWRRQRQLEGYRKAMQKPEIRERVRQGSLKGAAKCRGLRPWLGKRHSEETKKKLSALHQGVGVGDSNNNFGKHWWKDPNDKTKSHPYADGEQPEGWVRGKWTFPREIKALQKREHKDVRHITNGISNRYILANEQPPPGWRYGMVKCGGGTAGMIWITDGSTHKLISSKDVIPYGWRRGMK